MNAGSVSAITRFLPGGYYSVAAHYAGDGKFSPSDSNNIGVTVTPESTTTTEKALTFDATSNLISFTSVVYGTFVYLRSDVLPNSSIGIPTGSVNFVDASGTIAGNPYQLNSQGFTATPNGIFSLALGPHSITSSYGGDPSFAASSSSPVSFTITQASTTAVVSATPAGQGATLTATVNSNSGGNPPSGTVSFVVGGSAVGNPIPVTGVPATINPLTDVVITGAQGTAVFADSQLANGAYTISATYSGDANYAPSTAPAVQVSLQPDFAMSISSASMSISNPGASGTISLNLALLDGFTGAVTFGCTGLPAEASCTFTPASLQASGVSALTVTTSGPHAIARFEPHEVIQVWSLSVILFPAVFLMETGAVRRRNRLFALVIFAFLLGIVGCSGGSGSGGGGGGGTTDPGTPAGSYTVTIMGTSGTISHTTTLNVTIQ